MPSFRLARPALLALAIGAAFSAGFCLRAQGQDDASFDLVTYRTAMDQLRAGRPQNAQTLLEIARDNPQTPLCNESALLLAYLEDESGQGAEARKTLSALTAPSPLADAYLRRLGGTPLQTQPLAAGATNNPARLVASDARITKLEAYMVDLVNDEREKHGLNRLQTDPQLAEVARAHSAEMRDKKYFSHDSPTRGLQEPLDRYVAAFGVKPHVVAENIYKSGDDGGHLGQQDTLIAQQAFMNSPHHRDNILESRVTRIGIGLCADSKGVIWITQMFSHPF